MVERAPGPCGRVGSEEGGEVGDGGGQSGEQGARVEGGLRAGEQVQIDAGIGGRVVGRQDPGEGRSAFGVGGDLSQCLAEDGGAQMAAVPDLEERGGRRVRRDVGVPVPQQGDGPRRLFVVAGQIGEQRQDAARGQADRVCLEAYTVLDGPVRACVELFGDAVGAYQSYVTVSRSFG